MIFRKVIFTEPGKMKDRLYLLTDKSLGRFTEDYFQIFPYDTHSLVHCNKAENTIFNKELAQGY